GFLAQALSLFGGQGELQGHGFTSGATALHGHSTGPAKGEPPQGVVVAAGATPLSRLPIIHPSPRFHRGRLDSICQCGAQHSERFDLTLAAVRTAFEFTDLSTEPLLRIGACPRKGVPDLFAKRAEFLLSDHRILSR